MNLPSIGNPTKNWSALLIAGLLFLGAMALFFVSVVLSLLSLGSLPGINSADPTGILILASGTLLLGLLLLPGIFFNFIAFLNKPSGFPTFPQIKIRFLIPLLILIWLGSLGLGQLVIKDQILSILVLPAVNIFAVGLPLLFYIHVSLRGLEFNSPRRNWTVFGANLLVSPILAFFFEFVAVIVIVLLLFAFSSFIPGLQEAFKYISTAYRTGSFDEKTMTQNMINLLLSPPLALGMLGTFSFLVPIIEETLKTILIWPLLTRINRLQDGFILGVLCGAAFALAENIGFISAGSTDWAASVVTRAVTALPHIFNSGIMGWALVSACKEKRYGRLAAAFLSVILIHGTWNAISLALAMNDLTANLTNIPLFLKSGLPWLAAWIVLALGSFGGLIFCNLTVRRARNREQA